jgi:hypothetical protein
LRNFNEEKPRFGQHFAHEQKDEPRYATADRVIDRPTVTLSSWAIGDIKCGLEAPPHQTA